VIRAAAGRPLVVGHRGAPALFPEHTLASFAAAVEAGADLVELDVGRGLLVAHSDRELPERPLSLEEALEYLGGTGVGVLVDLKRPGLEQAVAAALRRHGLLPRALVSSTSPRVLRRLARAEPELARSITYPHDRYRVSRLPWPPRLAAGAAAALRSAMPVRAPLLLAAARSGALTLHHSLVSRSVVRCVRSRGAALVAWTVDDPARIARLAELGVDAIVTDDPGGARRALATLTPP